MLGKNQSSLDKLSYVFYNIFKSWNMKWPPHSRLTPNEYIVVSHEGVHSVRGEDFSFGQQQKKVTFTHTRTSRQMQNTHKLTYTIRARAIGPSFSLAKPNETKSKLEQSHVLAFPTRYRFDFWPSTFCLIFHVREKLWVFFSGRSDATKGGVGCMQISCTKASLFLFFIAICHLRIDCLCVWFFWKWEWISSSKLYWVMFFVE